MTQAFNFESDVGGSQESGGRGGTENLLGIVAMGVAASRISTRIEQTDSTVAAIIT